MRHIESGLDGTGHPTNRDDEVLAAAKILFFFYDDGAGGFFDRALSCSLSRPVRRPSGFWRPEWAFTLSMLETRLCENGTVGSAARDGSLRPCCGRAAGTALASLLRLSARSAQGLRKLLKSVSLSWTLSIARSGSTRKVSSKEHPACSSIIRTCW